MNILNNKVINNNKNINKNQEKEKLIMITVISTLNDETATLNLENAAVIEILSEAKKAAMIPADVTLDNVVTLNGAPTDSIKDILKDIQLNDGDSIGVDVNVIAPQQAPANNPATDEVVRAVLNAAGGFTEKQITVKSGTTVVEVCIREKDMLGLSDNDVQAAEKFVNDVKVNNDYILKNNDNINVCIRPAGTKGAGDVPVYIDYLDEDGDIIDTVEENISGVLSNLPAFRVIPMLFDKQFGKDSDQKIKTVEFEDNVISWDSPLAEIAFSAPLTAEAELSITVEDKDDCCDECDQQDTCDEDNEEIPDGAEGVVNVILPGGFDEREFNIIQNETTVEEVVTNPTILAATAMNVTQAQGLKYTVNDVEVPLTYKLHNGDCLGMYPRPCGTKG